MHMSVSATDRWDFLMGDGFLNRIVSETVLFLYSLKGCGDPMWNKKHLKVALYLKDLQVGNLTSCVIRMDFYNLENALTYFAHLAFV